MKYAVDSVGKEIGRSYWVCGFLWTVDAVHMKLAVLFYFRIQIFQETC